MRLTSKPGKATGRRVRALAGPTAAGLVAGALGAYFLAPDHGRARRRLARDRAAASIRHGRRRLAHTARVRLAFRRGRALGLAHRFGCAEAAELDDATLAHKVESVLFRDPTVPKGRISINAERGTVFLRGEVASDGLIQQLDRAVREIRGVRRVENLLHPPGTPAPHVAPGDRRGGP
ncbi:MAG: BON domain-containing protein [Gaiellaceae bacterium]